jgi:NADPH:quinone reductase-like Zn-dependent oxidoreductase
MLEAAGAVALGTAGGPPKRALLRSLGVAHAAGSRDTGFACDLALAAGGADVVLNSLTSPGMVGGALALLRRGGRLVEIGKRDVWSGTAVARWAQGFKRRVRGTPDAALQGGQLFRALVLLCRVDLHNRAVTLAGSGAAAGGSTGAAGQPIHHSIVCPHPTPDHRQRPDVSYSFVAVDFLPPPILGAQMRRLAARLAAGAARPLRGAAYPLPSAAAALRLLAQATHSGKVLALAPRAPLLPPAASAAARASVVVTGGAGGLGLLMARWLATTGQARRITLLGRRGRPAGAGAAQAFEQLVAGLSGDVMVTLAAADTGSAEDSADAWRRIGGADAVLHAAGVLQVLLGGP